MSRSFHDATEPSHIGPIVGLGRRDHAGVHHGVEEGPITDLDLSKPRTQHLADHRRHLCGAGIGRRTADKSPIALGFINPGGEASIASADLLQSGRVVAPSELLHRVHGRRQAIEIETIEADLACWVLHLFVEGAQASHQVLYSTVAPHPCWEAREGGVGRGKPFQTANMGVGDGVELCVQPAFRAAHEPRLLRPRPPFFDRRLDAVRCALR